MNQKKILSYLWDKSMKRELIVLNMGLSILKDITVCLKNCKSTYTEAVKRADKHKIVIGMKLVAEIAKMPEEVDSKKLLRSLIPGIKKAFKGLNYHEMGHVLFSDMTMKPFEECKPEHKGFAMQLFNIIEDPIIERAIIKYVEVKRPYDASPKGYINYIKKQVFKEQAEEYHNEDTLDSFMQYILLLLRCGRKNIHEDNKIFLKYSDHLVPMIMDITKEKNGTERQKKGVILANWIIENIEEFKDDFEYREPPEDFRKVDDGGPGIPLPTEGGLRSGDLKKLMGKKPTETKESESPEHTEGSGPKEEPSEDTPDEEKGGAGDDEDEEGDGDEGEDSEDTEDEADKEKDSEEEFDDSSAKEDDDIDEDEIFDEILSASASHEFVLAREEFEITDEFNLEQGIQSQLEKSKECIQNVSKFLKLFKNRIKPRLVGGYTSGRLNIREAMRHEAQRIGDTKIFDRMEKRGEAADLAISLVCDNSGSMRGTQSTLASIAALAIAQACEWSNVPFECCCFTKSTDARYGDSQTIILKEMDESFEKAKLYFGINDSSLLEKNFSWNWSEVFPFRGNSEEVNLFYIWKRFREINHKHKLMFVFCDGVTTGSSSNLMKVIKLMEDDGIYVIGVGLMAETVKVIYPHFKIFSSMSEMRDGLATYLIDTLTDFVTNKRR